MKLKQILTTAVLTACVSTAAMSQTYEKGDNLLNVGVGFGGSMGMPIGISFEHGFTDKISGGVYLGYAGKTDAVAYLGDVKYTYMLGAARASYHFNFNVDKLDPYVGVILGYNYAKVDIENSNPLWPTPTAGGMVYGGHAGARYLFSPKIGVFAEVGYGIGNLNAGLAVKF